MFQRPDGTPAVTSQTVEADVCVNAIDDPSLRAPYRKGTYDYTPWMKASRPTKKTCLGGDALGAYYNQASVRAALKVPTNITQVWTGCVEDRSHWIYTMLIQAS